MLGLSRVEREVLAGAPGGGRSALVKNHGFPEGRAGMIPPMDQVGDQTAPGNDRLELFRGLRARLDPAGDPGRTHAEGLYVRPAQSVGARLAAELALAPSSTHLVVGGVGSGKTTELLEACRQIGGLADTQAIYVDVSKRHDIGRLVPGAVAVQVGLALDERLESMGHAGADAQYLRDLAHGYWADPDFPDLDSDSVRVPGILVSPDPQLEDNVRRVLDLTKSLLDSLRTRLAPATVTAGLSGPTFVAMSR